MKKFIATVLSVAALSAAYGAGTIATLSNNSGATIYPLYGLDGVTKLAGTDYKVEVFTYNASQPDGFGVMVGSTVSPGANFRFNAGNSMEIPGTNPGGTADLIVRAWDSRTGVDYASATVRANSGKFTSDTLGGDPDGDGPLLPITPKSMATGTATGFQSFSLSTTLVPEPTTIALGALGAAALFIRRRK